MKPKHILLPLAALLGPFSARAADLMAGLGETTYHVSATDRGWWTDYYANDGGYHWPSNLSYMAGYGSFYGDFGDWYNFFVFDLPDDIVSIHAAQLQLWNPSNGYVSPSASMPYNLYDVSTPIGTLTAGGGGVASIPNDLSSGVSYGSTTVSSASNGSFVNISLNANFINAAEAANGGLIAIGGAIPSIAYLGPNQAVFTNTEGVPLSSTRLQITAVTAPQAGDRFGGSVSLSGGIGIVGAYRDDDKGTDSGSAYVFRNLDTATGAITQNVKLTASDGAANDFFGWSVSLSVSGQQSTSRIFARGLAAMASMQPGSRWSDRPPGGF